MSVNEIAGLLPRLRLDELRSLNAAIREEYRVRGISVIYDDAYGVWTEADQASAGAEAFRLMEREESKGERS